MSRNDELANISYKKPNKEKDSFCLYKLDCYPRSNSVTLSKVISCSYENIILSFQDYEDEKELLRCDKCLIIIDFLPWNISEIKEKAKNLILLNNHNNLVFLVEKDNELCRKEFFCWLSKEKISKRKVNIVEAKDIKDSFKLRAKEFDYFKELLY